MSPASTPLDDLGAAQHVAYALQLAVAAVFARAAAPKLRDLRGFAQTVVDYQVLPERAARAFAPLVVAAESAVAIALAVGAVVLPAALIAIVMTFAFAAATALNLRRGRDVSCGCFGDLEERISARGLARLALLLVALVALVALLVSGAADGMAVDRLADAGGRAAWYLVDVAALAAAGLVAATFALAGPDLLRVLGHVRPQRSRA